VTNGSVLFGALASGTGAQRVQANVSYSVLKAKNPEYRQQGLRLWLFQSFGEAYYGVWRPGTGAYRRWGMNVEGFKVESKKYLDKGYRLVDVRMWTPDITASRQRRATVEVRPFLGLVPITTPAYSPQSNGLAEAFVKTFKRDYVNGAELRDAEAVLAQLGGWFDDYNTRAPHSALGMRSPADYRADVNLSSSR
jgi:transposase InsO family protein